MSEVKNWKQLKVKTMWNGEVIAYEEAKEGEFVLRSEIESKNKQLKDKLQKFIAISNGLSIEVRDQFLSERLMKLDSGLHEKIEKLYAHQCDCEQLTKTGGEDE